MAKPKLPAATKRTAAAAKTKATVSKRTTRSNARPDVNTADGGDETLVQRAVNRLTRTFDRNHLSGLAPAFLELRRKDIQAVVDANKMSYEGLQRVVQRQAQVLKATIGEYQAVVGVMRRAGPAESVDKLDELARGAFRMALDNLTELKDVAAQAQADAFAVVKQRVRDSVGEARKILG